MRISNEHFFFFLNAIDCIKFGLVGGSREAERERGKRKSEEKGKEIGDGSVSKKKKNGNREEINVGWRWGLCW